MSNDPSTNETAEFVVPPLPSETPPRPGPLRVEVDIDALSHPGNVRTNNEDFYLVVRTGRSLKTLLTNLPEGRVPIQFEEAGYALAVADGMGGMAAGEVASQLAIATLVNLYLDTPDWIMRTGERESERLMERISRLYRGVDASLSAEARTDPNLAGMGTTLTLAYSLGRELFLGHVGDSRAYLLRGDELYQLTRDHTIAQALADTGVLRPEEALTHKLRHVLTRALGGNEGEVEADVQCIRLNDGDQVLLCTDGLTDLVDDAALAATLRAGATTSETCLDLVELALTHGGHDNVTVVLARYHFETEH